ncbi:bifunctional non-homologous end joining protein LigD [Nitrosospira briensis]|uniref:DNA ligase (ATP) n=1 Tax=Nitrosospira briensis TaxID=35799 RepID=A0A1I5BHE5_9PROT|nr:bifunctional non-homologous end joining protein LigD [Nitrosospira briensis]
MPGSLKSAKPARSVAAPRKKRPSPSPDLPENALKADLPPILTPELATLVDGPPNDADEWAYEIKFDGYRILARIEEKRIQLFTRNGNDWTHKLPHVEKAIAAMGFQSGWLDGEVVVPNDVGVPDFQALQNAFDSSRTGNIIYFVFDVPFYAGFDLRTVPLTARGEFLKGLFETRASKTVHFSETFDVPAKDIIASACRMGLEGVIGKRKSSTYVSRRSPDWIKLKCSQRQEFVVGGYTDPKGSRTGFGALLVGFYEDKKLRYAGNVGTGYSDKTLRDLKAKLEKIETIENPFAKTPDIPRNAHWVKPTLVAEVSFSEWTRDGHIRHPSFQGLRIDKKAESITREKPVHSSAPKPAPVAMPKVSNPDRVIDPSTGFTKIELVRYYSIVAPLMLEHLAGRPVSLVRAPEGITGELFFQKHLENARMPGVTQLDPALHPDHPRIWKSRR